MTGISEKLKNKLTVAENRLNNSDDCQNCGTELQGPYCHYCGQPDKNFFRFFPALLREMMGDLLDFDSRLTRTLKPLLFQPGKLAYDYMHGRRFRYTSPVRLYLFSSIIFFLLAGFITSFEIQRELSSNADPVSQETTIEVAEKPEVTDQPEIQEELELDTDKLDPPTATDDNTPWTMILDLDEDGNEIDAVNLPFIPQRLNDWVNGELAKSESKGKAIEADPTIITDKIFEMLPMTVFILLPVFALLLKLFYMFSNRYYTEHLIFALYNHSFIFVLATIMFALESGGALLVNHGWIAKSGMLATVLDWQSLLLLIWMPLYFWFALKRFYQQGWLLTSLKFVTLGVSYTVLITSVTVFVAVLSFLLL